MVFREEALSGLNRTSRKSSAEYIKCGISQGSNLAPILFLLYDLTYVNKNVQCLCFASLQLLVYNMEQLFTYYNPTEVDLKYKDTVMTFKALNGVGQGYNNNCNLSGNTEFFLWGSKVLDCLKHVCSANYLLHGYSLSRNNLGTKKAGET